MHWLKRRLLATIRSILALCGHIFEFKYECEESLEKIKELCKCLPDFADFQEELGQILKKSGTIISGHFAMWNKKHAKYFLRLSKIISKSSFQVPIATEFMKKLREVVEINKIDAFFAPDAGGASFIAYQMQNILEKEGVQTALYISRTNEERLPTCNTIIFCEKPKQKIVIVVDYYYPDNLGPLLKAVKEKGHEVAAIIAFAINAGSSKIKEIGGEQVPCIIMCEWDDSGYEWDKNSCPLCQAEKNKWEINPRLFPVWKLN